MKPIKFLEPEIAEKIDKATSEFLNQKTEFKAIADAIENDN